jgi:hypothetical protein
MILLSLYIVWNHGLNPARQKAQTYSGRIEKVYQKRKLYRTSNYLLKDDKTHNYSFYWLIKTDTGRRIRAEVPMSTWPRGVKGMKVVKSEGSRWPAIDYSDEKTHTLLMRINDPVPDE